MKSVIPAAFRNWKKGRCGWHRCRRRVKTEPNIGSNGSPGTGEDAAAIDIPIPCGQADLSDIGRRRRCRPRPIPRDNRILSRWRERFDSARERHHVPTTFKAHGDHFQGLREPSSPPKFHPLHGPANGHQCVEGQEENGYGGYCNHNLRRALPCTPPDVAGLLSAGYLTPPHAARKYWCGNEVSRASQAPLTQQLLKNTLWTKQR